MPIILAGGINTGNLDKAINLISPYGIDISSGVEKEPGLKDYNKIKDIISIAKKY